jgi:hypothetical protein
MASDTNQPGDKPESAGPDPVSDGDERLDGWKRIARYLNRNVRTLRRWEENEGLPVRRLMHDKLATVYAYRSELDAWLKQREEGAVGTPSTARRYRTGSNFIDCRILACI